MALVTTPAVLLRSFPYSESSRILRFFTRELGTVGVMAKGVRGRGRAGSELGSFAGGILTLYVSATRELHTFKEFAASNPRRALGSSVVRLGAASVLGELVLRHAGEEANAALFEALESALDHLERAEEASVVAVVLSEGWHLVSVLGYRPVLGTCVSCGEPLGAQEMARFDFAAGGVRCPRCDVGPRGPRVGPAARAQLEALVEGVALPARLQRPRAHLKLLSDFITYHVSGTRPLDSFAFLNRVLAETDA